VKPPGKSTNCEHSVTADRQEGAKKRMIRSVPKVNFISYADDFVITAISKEVIARECKQITTFMSSKISNNSRDTLHRDSL